MGRSEVSCRRGGARSAVGGPPPSSATHLAIDGGPLSRRRDACDRGLSRWTNWRGGAALTDTNGAAGSATSTHENHQTTIVDESSRVRWEP